MFSQIYRVHKIFNDTKNLNVVVIKDLRLMMFVVVLVLGDVILTASWLGANPLRRYIPHVTSL